MEEHVIIIGNGISGITAARHIRKISKKKITIISAESEYFFSRTALMYVYMGHMKFKHTQPYENDFWEKNNLNLIHAFVKKIIPAEKEIELNNGGRMQYDTLVIASGSKSNMYDWPGQNSKGVMGMYSKKDLENLEACTPVAKRAVVVGGGLIGIEFTEMLHSRGIPVTLLVREKSFWNGVLPKEESEMINRHIREHGIDLRLESELKEIIADENDRVKCIVTKSGENIPCDIVGLAAGVSPSVDFLKNCGIEIDKGVLVNEYVENSEKNIYAIGDCAQQRNAIGERKPVEAVWYTGRMMGETLAQTICGKRMKYNPGNWFNSAKFFDIEYQTYGWVWNNPKENEQHFYWENDCGKKAIRFSYEKNSRIFLGVNLFGIRMLHSFFDTMLTEKRTVDEEIGQLKAANFDPEFYKKYEKEVQHSFQKQQ